MAFVKPQVHFSNFWVIFGTLSISIIFWLLFKSIYPYPFFTADSYFYVETADLNIDVSLWPVGYSKFIRLVGFFSHSSMLLVTCQYFLLQMSLLSLFLAIRKFLFANFWLLAILYVFFFINPLFIVASNHIMSDIVFSSLSIFWLLQLVWIMLKPKWYMLILQAILLVIALSFRYSGLFYPIISIIAFIISPMKLMGKFMGIVIMFLCLFIFVQFTEKKMERITGVREFSSTSGWKKANNALYMYQHIAAYDKSPVPVKFQIIHQVVKSYFIRQHTPTDLYNTTDDPTTGCFYIWMNESPLLEYVKVVLGHGINIIDFRELAPFNQFMNDYGNFLIKRYPFEYCRYVLLPNLYRYFFPLSEIYGTSKGLGMLWRDFLGDHVKCWFGIESLSLPVSLFVLKDRSISVYPTLFTIIHLLFVVTLFLFWSFQSSETKFNHSYKVYLLLLSICILNFIFYSLLAISVIRFQFLGVIIEFSLILFHIDSLKNRIFIIGNS